MTLLSVEEDTELSPPEAGILDNELFHMQQQRPPFPNPESKGKSWQEQVNLIITINYNKEYKTTIMFN